MRCKNNNYHSIRQVTKTLQDTWCPTPILVVKILMLKNFSVKNISVKKCGAKIFVLKKFSIKKMVAQNPNPPKNGFKSLSSRFKDFFKETFLKKV